MASGGDTDCADAGQGAAGTSTIRHAHKPMSSRYIARFLRGAGRLPSCHLIGSGSKVRAAERRPALFSAAATRRNVAAGPPESPPHDHRNRADRRQTRHGAGSRRGRLLAKQTSAAPLSLPLWVRSDKTHIAQNESDFSDRRHVSGHPFLSLRASLRTYEPQQTPTITQ